jgi:ADP-ribose pyrophosphatase
MSRAVVPLRHDRVFDGFFKVDRYTLRHAQFSGGLGPPISREIFERGHAAAVLPYDPVLDRVVLIEQFRPGAFANDDPNPWMIEIVAGIIDPGETAAQVCVREGQEEAGLSISELVPLGTFYMSPGGSSETIALFVGLCDSSKAEGIHGLDAEGEDIRVFTESPEEAIAMVRDNRVVNAMTSLALLLFAERREALRADRVGSI